MSLPETIQNGAQLDDLLSAPTDGVVQTFRRMEGDLILLGVGGKMGPSLARMARRATEAAGVPRRIFGVSRFSRPETQAALNAQGIETIACDLLDLEALHRLPDVPNVVFMAGTKFGTTGQEALTWAMNSFLPGMICQKFRHSRIVAFSTGNIYPLSPLTLGGSVETDPPGPIGEYAMSCLGRERILEHFSRTLSVPTAILRLNYAIALRYGVLTDIARQIRDGRPIPLTMGMVNVIWQGDANAMALQCFDHATSPPFVINLAGPEQLSVRRIAMQLGELLQQSPRFEGEEAPNALLSNGQMAHHLFGYPRVSVRQMVHWTADWIRRGGEELDKPTHFEVRDGQF
ncbi:MAG: NAD(P)-dependent oxidoreductase [Chthonomonadaceae bacterium]|nr:NAD(P)-dependent oxidoreductase [Chthonomonadaceae bacterium]